MAKLTLLTMTQKILSSMDSDDINSIVDTEEAVQVVEIIEDTYNFMMTERDWPHLEKTCQLISLSDTSKPTHMRVPDEVSFINQIKYEITDSADTDRTFANLRYLTPQSFIDRTLSRASGDDNVDQVILEDNTPIFIFTDRDPTMWTSFDDNVVVFDAFDSDQEATINGSKTITLCVVLPVFSKSDQFIPDLPDKVFPLFLAECKRASHLQLKQQDSLIDSKRIIAGKNRQNNDDRAAGKRNKHVKFGRFPRSSSKPFRLK